MAVSLEALGNLIKYFDRQQCLPQSIFQNQMFLKSCGRNSQSLNAIKHRNSCPEVFYKKGVLRNFAKFTGKHLCQSLFFNKTAGLRSFFIEYLWWLILKTIATLFSVGKTSRNRVPCFSRLFLNKVKVSINVLRVTRKSALNYCKIISVVPHGLKP